MLKAGIWIGRVDKVFITHLHGDHCYDIVGLLALRGMRKVLSPVEVVGPVGIKELIETTRRLSGLYLPFELKIVELEDGVVFDLGWRSQELPSSGFEIPNNDSEDDEATPQASAAPSSSSGDATAVPSTAQQSIKPESQDWHIAAYPLDHRISCFGYIFTERSQMGSFDSSVAITKGAAGKDIGKLASGKDVCLPSGTILTRSDCLRPSFPGRKFVILGDTHACSETLHQAAANADLFVHEATFEAGFDALALRSKHSTTTMAVDCAIHAKVQRLIITHFSARYTEHGAPKTVQDLLEEARAHANGALPIDAAHDFWAIELPPKKEQLPPKKS
jgi:ribonuclease Z